MADWTFPSTTSAIVGFSTSTAFLIQSFSYTISSVTYGTISLGDLNVGNENLLNPTTETIRGFLTGRRETQGQVFPRGVYNK